MNNVGINRVNIKPDVSAKKARGTDIMLAGRRDGNNMRAFDKSFSVNESRSKSPEKEKDFENVLNERIEPKEKYESKTSESGRKNYRTNETPESVNGYESNTSELPALDNQAYQAAVKDVSDGQQKIEADPKLKAMQIFLQKMDSTLGIDGEKLVAAFAKLSIADLASSPEQSAEAVLAQFDLDPQQYKVASQLYAEMLAMTSMAGLQNQLQTDNQSAELSVLSNADARKSTARAGIKNMQDAFFVDGKAAKMDKHVVGAVQNGQQALSFENDFGQDVEVEEASWSSHLEPETTVDILDRMEALTRFANRSKMANGSPLASDGNQVSQGLKGINQFASRTAGAEVATDPTFHKNLTEGVDTVNRSADMNLKDGAATVENPFAFLSGSSDAGPENVGFEDNANWMNRPYDSDTAQISEVSEKNGFNGFSESESDTTDDEMTNDGTDSADPFAQFRDSKTQAIKPQFTVDKPTATPVEVQNNIKDIVGHAQVLMKNGGGEMKVKLSPEGMGDLNLKVKMVDGQVNVEMITASEDAKKLLEKGLADLKESLASNKLHLDSIKIESTKDASSQLGQQHQDLERQSAQKFLQDFRERNFMNRNQMFDLPGPRNMESQTRDLAVNTSYGVKKKLSDRRLDLVA